MSKVTVIIPVYNMALYVGKSIESVLKQTFTDIDLIIVNDGSTDNSLDIIKNYAKKDKRIHLINKLNAGLASAYNYGQAYATGKYVYFLDSDDWMEPDCIETLYNAAEANEADVVKAQGAIPEKNGKGIERHFFPLSKCNKVITNMLDAPEFVQGHVAQWTSLYRRDFLIKNNIWCPEFPQKLAPDIDFVYQVWAKCKRMFVVPKSFIHYRLDNANSDKNSGAKMSFYLLRGHLVARGTMTNLFLTKPYWNIKAQVEYHHFLFEFITHRCSKNRWAFIHGVSKIFRENLKYDLVGLNTFYPDHARSYKFIARAPGLYWLNDTLRFWSVSKNSFMNATIQWRFFGLYKRVIHKNEQRIYVCGFLIKKSTLKEKHEESDSDR